MKKNKKSLKVPFYAHLLSKQEMQNAAAGSATSPIKDNPTHETHKWPSDGDEPGPER